ncbi:MAG: hypothetical protein Q9164_005898 [Protoblastenia rupestris]
MQLRACKKPTGGKFKLSVTEKAKWPFLQPKIDGLRQDLQEAKGTLMLMLQVTSLAFTKRVADLRPTGSTSAFEMQEMVRTISALHQQPRPSDHECCESTQTDHCEDEELETTKGRGNVAAHTTDSARKSQIPTAVAPYTSMVKLGQPREPKYSARHTARGELANPDSSWPLEHSDLVVKPQKPLQGSNSTSAYPNQADMPIHEDDRQMPSLTSSSDPVQASEAGPMEQQIFFLKPILQDWFDKIVLSWTVQNPKLSGNAIAKHIKQHEKAGLYGMVKTLENLHPFEQKVVESAIANCRTRVEVAFALRTTSDLSARNIRLQGVPGLHFVVETNTRAESCSVKPIQDISGFSGSTSDTAFGEVSHRGSLMLNAGSAKLPPRPKEGDHEFLHPGASYNQSEILNNPENNDMAPQASKPLMSILPTATRPHGFGVSPTTTYLEQSHRRKMLDYPILVDSAMHYDNRPTQQQRTPMQGQAMLKQQEETVMQQQQMQQPQMQQQQMQQQKQPSWQQSASQPQSSYLQQYQNAQQDMLLMPVFKRRSAAISTQPLTYTSHHYTSPNYVGSAKRKRPRIGQNHNNLPIETEHTYNTSGMPMADDSFSGPSLRNTMSGSFGNIVYEDNQSSQMDLDGILAGEDLEARKIVYELLGKYTTLYE